MPQVKIAVTVPIDDGHAPRVVGKVDARHGGDVDEPRRLRIQEADVCLMTAPGVALTQQLGGRLPGLEILAGLLGRGLIGGQFRG